MDIVAITTLGRNVEEEAPLLAADLGLTAYETALTLRGAMPVIVLRTEERARALGLVERLRARGHQAVAVDTATVVASEQMFRPRRFVFDGNDLVAAGEGEEQRLLANGIVALVRAIHATRTEDVVSQAGRRFSLGRAAMTGGLMLTAKTQTETRRVMQEREAVLYVFRGDGPPWLFRASGLRYEGLGARMLRSQAENFEVLIAALRAGAAHAPYDTRLLQVRPATSTVLATSANHLSASSAGTIDLLAHVVAAAIRRGAYR